MAVRSVLWFALVVILAFGAGSLLVMPARAQEPRSMTCTSGGKMTSSDKVAEWGNAQLAGGKTEFWTVGAYLCAW